MAAVAVSLRSSVQWSEFGVSPQLEVRESEGWGRGLYAVATLSRGLEVIRTEPLVHVLSNDVRGQLCDFCLKESESLLKCGRCKFVRYCSKKCQRGDWKFHGGECRGIARAQPHSPTPLTRLVVRCLHSQTEGGPRHATDLLCSHEDKLSLKVKEDMATLMIGVRLLLENPEPPAMQEAYKIMSKALCNTFTIHGAGLDPVGAGLYIGPSLLNHSCLPNCVAVFSGSELAVRTITPVQQGDQLLVSYVDLLDIRDQRNRTLQRSYCFQCRCQRCLTETDPESPFQTLYASVERSSAETVRAAVEEGGKSLERIEDLRQKGDREHMLSECESLLSRGAVVLRDFHHVTVHTLRHLVFACIANGNWPKAIDTSRKLSAPLRHYLPEFHPVLAVHLLRLGKLLRVSGSTAHLAHSVTELSEAVRQLRVVYGPEHPSTLDALQMLQDSQSELRNRDCGATST